MKLSTKTHRIRDNLEISTKELKRVLLETLVEHSNRSMRYLVTNITSDRYLVFTNVIGPTLVKPYNPDFRFRIVHVPKKRDWDIVQYALTKLITPEYSKTQMVINVAYFLSGLNKVGFDFDELNIERSTTGTAVLKQVSEKGNDTSKILAYEEKDVIGLRLLDQLVSLYAPYLNSFDEVDETFDIKDHLKTTKRNGIVKLTINDKIYAEFSDGLDFPASKLVLTHKDNSVAFLKIIDGLKTRFVSRAEIQTDVVSMKIITVRVYLYYYIKRVNNKRKIRGIRYD